VGPPPGADDLIALWNDDLIDTLLGIVWAGYNDLYTDFLSRIPWSEDYDDVERTISQEFERRIRRQMDGFEPVDVQHGPFERESRAGGAAQPPQYDFAFVWNSDPRLMWPLEAKVLASDADTTTNLGDYVKTVQTRYLTCYYAPFSNGGAMLGYLRAGDPEQVVAHIGRRLGCSLVAHAHFPGRCHKLSGHVRAVPAGCDYPVSFRCHHLILPLA
jgi:hypothetical protein